MAGKKKKADSDEEGDDDNAAKPVKKGKKHAGDATNDKCQWTAENDEDMTDELQNQVKLGHQAQSGFKPEAWTAVAVRVNKRTTGKKKTAATCKSRWQKVRVVS